MDLITERIDEDVLWPKVQVVDCLPLHLLLIHDQDARSSDFNFRVD